VSARRVERHPKCGESNGASADCAVLGSLRTAKEASALARRHVSIPCTLAAVGPRHLRTLRWYCLVTLSLLPLGAGCESPGVATVGESAVFVLDTVATIRSDEFNRIRTVRFAGENLAILNEGPRQVLIVDRAGQILRRIGRLGRGPGEFQALTDGVWHEDTLYVLDALAHRIHVFSGDSLKREILLRDAGGIAERLFVIGGQLVLVETMPARFPGSPPNRVVRDSIRVLVADAASPSTWREVIRFPGSERFFQPVGQGNLPGRPAFWTTTLVELTSSGVHAADGRSGAIWLFRWNDFEREVWRESLDSVPYVSDSDLALAEERIDALASRRPDIQFREFARASLNVWGGRIPRPFYENVVSDGRVVAVQLYEYSDTPAVIEWAVLAASGGQLGQWRTAPTVRLVGIRGANVVAIATDSLDVESVLLLRSADLTGR